MDQSYVRVKLFLVSLFMPNKDIERIVHNLTIAGETSDKFIWFVK